MDYKTTISLPATKFPMRASLPKREPAFLKLWQDADIYSALMKEREGSPSFILHDGPPFANGDAHMGHALNMALKDFVLKSKNMAGRHSPFIPGWDCHGLPIEHKVMQQLEKEDRKDSPADPAEIRERCEAYARKFIDIQREQFQRLGVFGEWDAPYLTLDPVYESEILRGLATIVEKGLVYQGMRPVHWSSGCQTALAEAEVEYMDRRDTSVYVLFPLSKESAATLGLGDQPLPGLMIWTTTPWTLPANLAVAASERIAYVAARSGERTFVCAKSRLEALAAAAPEGTPKPEILKELTGAELKGITYEHPFLDRIGEIYLADFVTEDSGSGLVHIAPGHGQDDYQLGQREGLDILSPVDDNGCLTEECGLIDLVGKYVFDANPPIVELLRDKALLWADEQYLHSYPHCWRSKTPIVFRCVKQWFIRIDDVRADAIDAIDQVNWVPSWGVNRIRGAVETRPDWCISRQRTWGVPLPVFYRANGEAVLDAAVVRAAADLVEKEGTNVWFRTPDAELASRLGLSESGLTKGLDTLDVWIDSGSSHLAVLNKRLPFPSDLYLEGSDQHRGWFQSSLLISMMTNEAPPYREVLTNGFVVDLDGKKLSKSNSYQKPTGLMDFVDRYGADILRLWVASQDYRDDVPFSEEIFTRVTDTYRLFRNSLRVLLGNLSGFDAERDSVPESEWTELELYIIDKLRTLTATVNRAYETYEFHMVYHAINRFCAVDLSALYIDVTKDRLYCDSLTGTRRLAAQTAMHEIVSTLARLLAPIMPFTSEEVWQHLHAGEWDESQGLAVKSVHMELFPEAAELPLPEGFAARWEKLLGLRTLANEQLEAARREKLIGKSQEASLEIVSPDFTEENDGDLLRELLIVSHLTITHGEEPSVKAAKAPGAKCVRCWKQSESLGTHADHPELCPRCTEVVVAAS